MYSGFIKLKDLDTYCIDTSLLNQSVDDAEEIIKKNYAEQRMKKGIISKLDEESKFIYD